MEGIKYLLGQIAEGWVAVSEQILEDASVFLPTRATCETAAVLKTASTCMLVSQDHKGRMLPQAQSPNG